MTAARSYWRSTLAQPRCWRWLGVGWVLIYTLTVLTIGGNSTSRYWFLAFAAAWPVLLAELARRWRDQSGLSGARPWLRRLDLIASNLALVLVLGELGLRVFGAWFGNTLLINERLEGWRLAPHRNYGNLLFTNGHGYASREFHTEKRPGVRRIAALGDSFAVGVVRQDKNFLTLLEDLLNTTEVYNFGVTGIGPREYDAILRSEVWRFEPDLVLVCFFVGNDVTGWWRLPSTDRLDPHAHRLYVLGQRTWRLGREFLRRREEIADAVPIHQPLVFPQLSRQTHLEHEVQRLSVCRHSQTQAVAKSWNRTFQHLDRIITQCRDRCVPLAVVLIPDEVQVNADLLREVLGFGPIEAEDVDLTMPQRRLCAYLHERAVRCLDLMPEFLDRTDAYRPRDTHWNENGNRRAAERIAAWLQTASFPNAASSSAAAAEPK